MPLKCSIRGGWVGWGYHPVGQYSTFFIEENRYLLASLLACLLSSFLASLLPSLHACLLPCFLPCLLLCFLPYTLACFLAFFLACFFPCLLPSFLARFLAFLLARLLVCFLPSLVACLLARLLPSFLTYFRSYFLNCLFAHFLPSLFTYLCLVNVLCTMSSNIRFIKTMNENDCSLNVTRPLTNPANALVVLMLLALTRYSTHRTYIMGLTELPLILKHYIYIFCLHAFN